MQMTKGRGVNIFEHTHKILQIASKLQFKCGQKGTHTHDCWMI